MAVDKRRVLFIGGIPSSMSEEVISDHFSQYDTIVNVRIMKDRKTKAAKGYAFVTLTDHLKIPAILAIPQVIAGRAVDVQVASRRGEKEKWKEEQQKKKLFVSNVPSHIDNDGLGNYFTQFGEVRNSFVIRDFVTKASLNYGYVEFVDPNIIEKVFNMENLKLDGADLICMPYQGKPQERKLMVSKFQRLKAGKEETLLGQPLNSSEDESRTDQPTKEVRTSDLPITCTKTIQSTFTWPTAHTSTIQEVIGVSTRLNQDVENYEFKIRLEIPKRTANSYPGAFVRSHRTSAGPLSFSTAPNFGFPKMGTSNFNGEQTFPLSSGVFSRSANKSNYPGFTADSSSIGSTSLLFPRFRLFN